MYICEKGGPNTILTLKGFYARCVNTAQLKFVLSSSYTLIQHENPKIPNENLNLGLSDPNDPFCFFLFCFSYLKIKLFTC